MLLHLIAVTSEASGVGILCHSCFYNCCAFFYTHILVMLHRSLELVPLYSFMSARVAGVTKRGFCLSPHTHTYI